MNALNLYIASCDRQGGIYHYHLSKDAAPKKIGFTPADRPMYLTAANGKLYALLRAPFENEESGLIVYDLDRDGRLKAASPTLSTQGTVACHLTVEDDAVFAVNYVSGSIIQMPDRLIVHSGCSIHPERQQSPHPHFISATPDQKYLCVTDLGTDQILIYHKDLTLKDTVALPAGHGPRHLAFHPNGKAVFCANELCSTVSLLHYNNGELTLIDTVSTLPVDFNGDSTAAAIRCIGDTIYVSNRGHDSISILDFSNDQLTLRKTLPTCGKSPRDFWICGDLLIVANELSDQVVLFSLEKERIIAQIDVKSPVCILTD